MHKQTQKRLFKSMKKILCSFADKSLSKTVERFKAQAESMEVFDKIYIYSQNNLDKSFKKKFKKYLIPYSTGFGYWCWKPQIILQTLEKVNDGDIVLYADIGCHLNINGKKRLSEYCEIVDKAETGILATRSTKHLDRQYTKMDVFKYFGVENNPEYTDTKTFEAGIAFFRKDKATLEFLHEWLDAIINNFRMLTDTPSIAPNFDDFIAHRHDQSIFSILGKKYNINEIPTEEEAYAEDWDKLRNFPILAKRDKIVKSRFHKKFRPQIAKFYHKLWQLLYNAD